MTSRTLSRVRVYHPLVKEFFFPSCSVSSHVMYGGKTHTAQKGKFFEVPYLVP